VKVACRTKESQRGRSGFWGTEHGGGKSAGITLKSERKGPGKGSKKNSTPAAKQEDGNVYASDLERAQEEGDED